MRVDFKEIPSAQGGSPNADTWEFFARDFLIALGLEHESGPDRGADDGRDLIMLEKRAFGGRKLRWVVSCKHHAHSGSCVSDGDEIDILGRVDRFSADGFITFYSTLPSATLERTLDRHCSKIDVQRFDRASIEHHLLTPALGTVFKRYLPVSHKNWGAVLPVAIGDVYEPLPCVVCATDLLIAEEKQGNIVFITDVTAQPERVVDVYACCKKCDRLAGAAFRKNPNVSDRWMDVNNYVIPRRFVQNVCGLINELRSGETVYDEAAFRKYQGFVLRIAQMVVRETTADQRAHLKELDEFPF